MHAASFSFRPAEISLACDLACTQEENAAWEAKLQLKSRPSYLAAGTTTDEEAKREDEEASVSLSDEEPEIIKDEPLDSPPPQPKPMAVSPAMEVSPIVEVFMKLLGGFCIPCKQAASA